jgi:hypothetical protein
MIAGIGDRRCPKIARRQPQSRYSCLARVANVEGCAS